MSDASKNETLEDLRRSARTRAVKQRSRPADAESNRRPLVGIPPTVASRVDNPEAELSGDGLARSDQQDRLFEDQAPIPETTLPGGGSVDAAEPAGAPMPSEPVLPHGQGVTADGGSSDDGRIGLPAAEVTERPRKKRGPQPGETEEAYENRKVGDAEKEYTRLREWRKARQKARANAELEEDLEKFRIYRANHPIESPYRRFDALASIGNKAQAKGIPLAKLQEMIEKFDEKP